MDTWYLIYVMIYDLWNSESINRSIIIVCYIIPNIITMRNCENGDNSQTSLSYVIVVYSILCIVILPRSEETH